MSDQGSGRFGLAELEALASAVPESSPPPPVKVAPPFRMPDTVTDGERNNRLTSLAGALRQKNMSEAGILAAITVENEEKCEPPYPGERLREIARWAGKKDGGPVAGEAFPLTDAGNGERFARAVSGEFCYCPEQHEWMRWDGRGVWLPDSGSLRATHRAKGVARAIPEEAAATADPKTIATWRSWANYTESQRGTAAMLSMARAEPMTHRRITDFDADASVLNCENGVLDLRTGALLPHTPGRLCSRQAAVQYVPGAKHPALDRYLASTFAGNDPLRDFMARALGYSLTGDTAAESLFMVIGPGGSGKTTLVESFKNMLGTYAVTISGQTLLRLKARGASPRNDVAALVGRRFAAASEIAKGEALDQELVKSLTGGERVTARFLHKEFFDFQPLAKFWLAANDAPTVSDDDTGAWRRLHRIPFQELPEAARDPELKRTLLTDPAARSALLSWSLAGCMDWRARGAGRIGLAVPEQVAAATLAYRQEGDPLAGFLDECCLVAPDSFCPVADLRGAYVHWAKAAGEANPVKLREFNQRLEARGLSREVKRIGDDVSRPWIGITLANDQKRVL